MTKKKQTYASQAKTIMNKYKLRLGDKFDKSDPLALAAMNAELTMLQQEQEATRETELGVPAQGQQFAYGGELPMYEGFNFSQFLNKPNPTVNPGVYDQLPATSAEAMAAQTGSQPVGGGISDGFQSRVPWMGAAAGAIGGILANRKIDLPSYDYEEWNPEKAQANLVDYSRGREQTMRERDQAQAMITRNARGIGSQAGLMENVIAGATGTQRAAGSAFNQSLEQEGNVNAQIKNQVSQFNASQAGQAAQINARNKMYANQFDRENLLISDQRRQGRIGSVVNAVQGYGQDLMSAKRDDQMINMMSAESDNYDIRQGEDSFWKRFFQLSKDGRIDFKNTGDKSKPNS